MHLASSLYSIALTLPILALYMILCIFLRGLRMIALLLGSKMTDSSVTAIVQSYKHLEFLDLSGYVISLESGYNQNCLLCCKNEYELYSHTPML